MSNLQDPSNGRSRASDRLRSLDPAASKHKSNNLILSPRASGGATGPLPSQPHLAKTLTLPGGPGGATTITSNPHPHPH